MRSWNPYYLHPTLRSEEFDGNFSEMADHFHTLNRTISTTGKSITNFELPFNIGAGLPSKALWRPIAALDMVEHMQNAYSRLTSFELIVTTYVDSESSHDVSLPLLTRLLEKMSGLRRLDLHLNKESFGNFITSYYRFRQVFPNITCWPNLTELRISGLAIEGLELIRLLQLRTLVHSLMLSVIELLNGTWEGVHRRIAVLMLVQIKATEQAHSPWRSHIQTSRDRSAGS